MEVAEAVCKRTPTASLECRRPDLHRRHALLLHAELRRGDRGEVDDAAPLARAAVGDGHVDLAAVALVRDLDDRAERQLAVRGGELLAVHRLAARRLVAVQLAAVPGGEATLDLRLRLGRRRFARRGPGRNRHGGSRAQQDNERGGGAGPAPRHASPRRRLHAINRTLSHR